MAGKGRPKTGGRVKGQCDPKTKAIREMIEGALVKGGGQDWLQRQMDVNPVAFMGLVGKVLPMQITGDANAPIVIRMIRFTDDA